MSLDLVLQPTVANLCNGSGILSGEATSRSICSTQSPTNSVKSLAPAWEVFPQLLWPSVILVVCTESHANSGGIE